MPADGIDLDIDGADLDDVDKRFDDIFLDLDDDDVHEYRNDDVCHDDHLYDDD
jgi:hypothetical protein